MAATDGMSETRISFYAQTLSRWLPDKDATILVVGGGTNDRNVLRDLGFRSVVISNLDPRTDRVAFAPYAWKLQDAEDLDCADESFDFVIVHAALHHCASPHRALLEMYRVARRALVFFESRDSLLMRFLERLGFTQRYETTAVSPTARATPWTSRTPS